MNITPLGFAAEWSLNWIERQPMRSTHDENNYWRQQELKTQYIKMSVNGVSTICGLVSMVFHQ